MRDKTATNIGCIAVGLYALFAIAWIGFIGWLLYTVVSWLVTK